jgi:hypothetical protein
LWIVERTSIESAGALDLVVIVPAPAPVPDPLDLAVLGVIVKYFIF